MQCPVCGERLRPIVRHEVEVDICPGCKGVWLDRGELEKILQYAAQGGLVGESGIENQGPPPPPAVDSAQPAPRRNEEPPRRAEGEYRPRRDDDDDDDDHGRHGRGYGRRRRGSWLGEIFESLGGD